MPQLGLIVQSGRTQIADVPFAIREIVLRMVNKHRVQIDSGDGVAAVNQWAAGTPGAAPSVENSCAAWAQRVDKTRLAVDVFAFCDKAFPARSVVF